MRWSVSKLRARFLLGWWFVRAFLDGLRLWRRRQIRATFLARSLTDGLSPASENDRALLPSFSKCVACSLCTFSCSAIKEGRAPSSFEPKFLMLGYGRSARDSEVFREEWMPCMECEACTVECPNDVPIHDITRILIDRRHERGFRS